MNGLEDESMAPQSFLYGCVLEAGKEVLFNPEDDEFEHQLDLRMACVDPSTKDELHMVEVEGQDTEGQTIKAVLVSLKPSNLPSVCLGGFTITPPATFRLKTGTGPIHISGQHLVMMEADQSIEEEEDDEEEEEEEVECCVGTSKKRPASSPAPKSQKKMKMGEAVEEDDEEDADDDEDEEEEESEEEKSPVKAKQTPSKKVSPAQNGKNSTPNTPAKKQSNVQDKSPKGKAGRSPKAPSTPKVILTLPEIKAKITEAVKKGVSLPKNQPKFENLMKHSENITDAKVIAELWKWRQTMKDAK